MKQTKEMPVVPIQTGEVFLQDKIVDETHCYICKKEFNKFDDKDMLLLRIKEHEMGFCCPGHRGIVQEFVRQFKHMPGGWEKYNEKDNSDTVDSNDTAANNNTSSTNKKKKNTKRRR